MDISPEQYIQMAQMVSQDPGMQWDWALNQRRTNPDQNLANAEHYLWNRSYAQEGPIQAAGAFVTPIGYYAAKKLGLLSGRSEPSLEQMGYGLLGAYRGAK